jgi:AsmA protein
VENLALAVAGKQGADDVDARLTAPRLQWGADKLAAEKIELVAKMKPAAGGDIGLVASIPAIAGSNRSFKVDGLNVDVSAELPGARYTGKFSSSLSGDLRKKQFTLPDLKGNLAASDKKMLAGELKLDIAGTAQLDLAHPEATLNLASRLDESIIKIKGGASPLTNPHISLDIDIDRIDADRYLPAKTQQPQIQAEKPFDFSSLNTLDASGSLRIGRLKLYNIKSSTVRLDFNTMVGDTVKPAVATRAADQPKAGLKGLFR